MSEPTLLEVLRAVQFALNKIPNTRLTGCPGRFKDTYQLVKAVDVQLYFREENKEDGDE